MALSPETIAALLAKELAPPSKKTPQVRKGTSNADRSIYAREHQTRLDERRGPVRWYEKPMKCLHKAGYHPKGCGTQTYIRVDGKPMCMVHAIAVMNDLVVQMTEQKFEVVNSTGGSYDREPIL